MRFFRSTRLPSGGRQNQDMPPAPPIGTNAPGAIAHYENFPVASLLCPPHLRAPIAAIYHFARTADDIADEGDATAGQRLEELQAYRADLHATTAEAGVAETSSRWPHIFGPLAWAVRTQGLSVELLADLLDAFMQDIDKNRLRATYRDQAELLDYCRRSANPVGRLLLQLYGVTDARSLEQSDAICTALQLINFWQDLSVDIPRGRFYLTDADREQFSVLQTDIEAQRQTENATKLIAACVESAGATMRFGMPLVHRVPGRAGWELRLVVQGGVRILDKIAALRFATLNQRPTLKAWDYVVMVWRALWM